MSYECEVAHCHYTAEYQVVTCEHVSDHALILCDDHADFVIEVTEAVWTEFAGLIV